MTAWNHISRIFTLNFSLYTRHILACSHGWSWWNRDSDDCAGEWWWHVMWHDVMRVIMSCDMMTWWHERPGAPTPGSGNEWLPNQRRRRGVNRFQGTPAIRDLRRYCQARVQTPVQSPNSQIHKDKERNLDSGLSLWSYGSPPTPNF